MDRRKVLEKIGYGSAAIVVSPQIIKHTIVVNQMQKGIHLGFLQVINFNLFQK